MGGLRHPRKRKPFKSVKRNGKRLEEVTRKQAIKALPIKKSSVKLEALDSELYVVDRSGAISGEVTRPKLRARTATDVLANLKCHSNILVSPNTLKKLKNVQLKRSTKKKQIVKPEVNSIQRDQSEDIWVAPINSSQSTSSRSERQTLNSIYLPPQSYNSAPTESYPALNEAVRIIEKRERNTAKEKKLAEEQRKAAALLLRTEALSELTVGLFGKDEPPVNDSSEGDEASSLQKIRKLPEKITAKQRRRRSLHKFRQSVTAKAKSDKKRLNIEFSNLKKICREADQEGQRLRTVLEPKAISWSVEKRKKASMQNKLQKLATVQLLRLRQANAVIDQYLQQEESGQTSLRLIPPARSSDLLLDRYVAAQSERGLLLDCRSRSEGHRLKSSRRPARRTVKTFDIRRDEDEQAQLF